ncbi:uncharacterized protein LOC114306060 [Camellia sinensis]|uniref:uncharacterized protein LOC114306060 n=1 Tax=Camellia sinensis TaxID=4442 RepID=UPI0010357046|nr:uncharacterized protein LOC114306060 [Camellia sinensis]
MGRPKLVTKDLLASLPSDVDAQPAQTQPPSKSKRIKKAQPKAKVTQVETEDTLPISKLAESDKSQSAVEKRRADAQPSESTRSKKPTTSSANTSGSKKPDAPWAPRLLWKTSLLWLAIAIQHAHSFSIQSFENREKLIEARREVSSLQKTNKSLQSKMKKLEDQVEAAIKAQTNAEEKAESAEAIKKVADSQKREAEDKMALAQKELQEALATMEAKIKDVDEKAYAHGMTDVTEAYEIQVKQASNKGFTLGWMFLLKKLNVPEDSPFRNADAIPLPFPPPPPPAQSDDDSESEEEVLGDEISKEFVPKNASVDVTFADKSLDETLQEIDAELAAEKAADVASQQSSEVLTQVAADAEEP